jgi:hypothetical protein
MVTATVMALPRLLTRLLPRASATVAASAGRQGAQTAAKESGFWLFQRPFLNYFRPKHLWQDVRDSFTYVGQPGAKGVTNTLLDNFSEGVKKSGGIWLPVGLSTVFSIGDAITEAREAPDPITGAGRFFGRLWKSVAANLSGVAFTGAYMGMFPKTKGIPSLLMQNMTYEAGLKTMDRLTGRKPVRPPTSEVSADVQHQLAYIQQQRQLLQQQAEALNNQIQFSQRLGQQYAAQPGHPTHPAAAQHVPAAPSISSAAQAASNAFNLPAEQYQYLNQALAPHGTSLEQLQARVMR